MRVIKWSAVVGGLTAAAVLLSVSSAGAALVVNSSCPDSNACVWTQDDYDGQRTVVDAGDTGAWRSVDPMRYSAKNRFGSRKFKLGRQNGSGGVNQVSCLDPGDNRPDPGYFDAVYVSDSTSDRCG